MIEKQHYGQILIVDDRDVNRDILSTMLQASGLSTVTANSGEQALQIIAQQEPDVVLLDVMMEGMDGIEVLEIIRKNPAYQDIPVIMLTGVDDPDLVLHCIRIGAEDYVLKPFRREILMARIQAGLDKRQVSKTRQLLLKDEISKNERLTYDIAEAVFRSVQAQESVIFALASLAEQRDPETGQHLMRIHKYCELICQEMKSSAKYAGVITGRMAYDIPSASTLHDIGKVGVPDAVLLKNGKLEPDEFAIMKTHAALGAETLRRVSEKFPDNQYLRLGCEIAHYHHERWDGNGYPVGLSGEDIPISARIVTLADVYDALRSKRCYKEGFSHEKSLAIMESEAGKAFDPELFEIFKACADRANDAFEHYLEEEQQQ
jgi:putative two-component system response regulator